MSSNTKMKCKQLGLLASGAFAALLGGPASALAQTNLGTAQSFAVLGGSAVTNTGSTVLTGDLGVSPGSSITGFPPGIATGTTHAADAVALQAQTDLTTAYNDLAGQVCNSDLTGQDLGGLTLTPGVYCFSTSAQLTGTLTLNALGNPDSVFIFQIGSTLTTATTSTVLLINAGQDCNVFWQVGSSATLGTGTLFVGNILALTSITLVTGADVSGRVLARNGAVTLDTNDVAVAVCGGPTATPSATLPPAPTGTNTPTPTAAPPTATRTLTPGGPALTATATVISTATPTVISTATATPSSAATPSPTCPILCVRLDGCLRWELISANIEASLVTFTWRLTNFCRGRLTSANFLFTHGHPQVVGMKTGQIYTSPGGHSYTVQVNQGAVPGVLFRAPGAGTIHNGQSDLFIFTTTLNGINSGTFFWNSATTTDGERGAIDTPISNCPVGCDLEPVLDPSARREVASNGEWDIVVRWNVHPWATSRLFALYRVKSDSPGMTQVNTAPLGPDAAGAVSVEDLVAPETVDRYQIQPLDAQGSPVGPAVRVPVEAVPTLVSLYAWPLLLVIAGLGLGGGLLRRRSTP